MEHWTHYTQKSSCAVDIGHMWWPTYAESYDLKFIKCDTTLEHRIFK